MFHMFDAYYSMFSCAHIYLNMKIGNKQREKIGGKTNEWFKQNKTKLMKKNKEEEDCFHSLRTPMTWNRKGIHYVFSSQIEIYKFYFVKKMQVFKMNYCLFVCWFFFTTFLLLCSLISFNFQTFNRLLRFQFKYSKLDVCFVYVCWCPRMKNNNIRIRRKHFYGPSRA